MPAPIFGMVLLFLLYKNHLPRCEEFVARFSTVKHRYRRIPSTGIGDSHVHHTIRIYDPDSYNMAPVTTSTPKTLTDLCHRANDRYTRLFRTAASKPNNTPYPEASLMALPLEILQMILKLAIPKVLPAKEIHPILLTNLQLTWTSEYVFYSESRRYEMSLNGNILHFIGEKHDLEATVPTFAELIPRFPSYDYFQSVVLRIQSPSACCTCSGLVAGNWPAGCKMMGCLKRFEQGIRRVTMMLSQLENLTVLEVHLVFPYECIDEDCVDDHGVIWSIFEPFFNVRGLDVAEIFVHGTDLQLNTTQTPVALNPGADIEKVKSVEAFMRQAARATLKMRSSKLPSQPYELYDPLHSDRELQRLFDEVLRKAKTRSGRSRLDKVRDALYMDLSSTYEELRFFIWLAVNDCDHEIVKAVYEAMTTDRAAKSGSRK